MSFFKRNSFTYQSDSQLADALISNNANAIDYVFHKHYNALLRWNAQRAFRKQDVEVRDLSHDLFIHLSANNWKRLKTYDSEKQQFVTWFSIVSHHFFLDQYEKEKKRNAETIDSTNNFRISEKEDDRWQPCDDENNELMEIMKEIRELLDSFEPRREREILIALLFNDEDPKEVALKHHVTVDNLYNIKRRAQAKLIKEYMNLNNK